MKSDKHKGVNKTNNFVYITISVAVIIITGICYHIVKENKKELLHKTENKNEIINILNELSSITVNDTISFGNESYIVNKVEADTSNLKKKFMYSLKNKSSNNGHFYIIITKIYAKTDNKDYPALHILFEQQSDKGKCYLKLDWENQDYEISDVLGENIPKHKSERKELSEILNTVHKKGLIETCKYLKLKN